MKIKQTNATVYAHVALAMRGRVINYFAMAFFGMQPLGGLLIGTILEYFGAPNTIS